MKHRILKQEERFYPQWKFPLLPFYGNYWDLWDSEIWFPTLEEAREWLKPSETPKTEVFDP